MLRSQPAFEKRACVDSWRRMRLKENEVSGPFHVCRAFIATKEVMEAYLKKSGTRRVALRDAHLARSCVCWHERPWPAHSNAREPLFSAQGPSRQDRQVGLRERSY